MLDVADLIKQAMKKVLFEEENKNILARQILGELKTKLKDIQEEHTAKIQYSILKKMFSDREKSISAYLGAGRNDLAEKEILEKEIISNFMAELEKELPKQLSSEEVATIISSNGFANIGECMKWFSQNYPDQDKKIISQVFKQAK